MEAAEARWYDLAPLPMKSSETMSVPGQASIVLLGRAMLSLLAAVAIPLQFLLSQTLELAGEWELSLDPENAGSLEQLTFDLRTSLPGTLDEAGIGKANTMEAELKREVMLHLQRKHEYIGKAWYRKTISVPFVEEDTKAILKMERVLWKSTVFVDGKKVSEADSLSTPHEHDLTKALFPGKRELLICIDNSRQFVLNKNDMAHGYTNETQIMWNGVLGDFAIYFLPVPELADLRIAANLRTRSVSVETGVELPRDSRLQLSVINGAGETEVRQTFASRRDGIYTLQMPGAVEPWNEFSPAVYTLEARLLRDGETMQRHMDRFGFRDIGTKGKVLTLNGGALFLRGTLECSIFPLTGHPPVNEAEWEQLYRSAKDYGLNHIRFHSWCPPKAAFSAADTMGVYLQVEPPNWNTEFGADEASARFIEAEARRIVDAYGNHPSFCLMSMGNELEGDFQRLRDLVLELKERDRRHLYATTAFTFQKGHGKAPEPVDDFFITQFTEKGWVRGQGVFDSEYPNFETDYSDAVKHLDVPLITHEIGQYSVFPNLKEIEKYTGVLEPLNFKAVERDLREKGLLHLAEDYLMASGQLAKILYKEEIERALKTEGISGFQLLDLHDFPGQGTALVGLLDAFWDSKGIVGPEEFKTFCSEVVPLIWMEKAVYRNSESIELEYGIANHFHRFSEQPVLLELTDKEGMTIQKKNTLAASIEVGKTSKLGTAAFDLSKIESPARLTLSLSLPGTAYRNSWQVWIYSDPEEMDTAESVVVTRSLAEATVALEAGKSVLLNPRQEDLRGLEGKFVQVFWSPVHFPDQPGTMGLLMDPEHEAFRQFPTEFHSNWQWWDLCKQSKALDFGDLPIDPIIRVVDNFFKNRNLTNLFEAKVGKGKLLFSAMNLVDELDSRLAAAQLRRSLERYMASDAFDPEATLSARQLERFFEQQ